MEKIGKTADVLMEKGNPEPSPVWIVNGFSCLAKPTAIRKLAKRAGVSSSTLTGCQTIEEPYPCRGIK